MSEPQVCGPGCRGCVYLGMEGACWYILATGKSKKSLGVKIRPGGGCALKKKGKREQPVALPISLPRKKPEEQQAAEPKEDKRKRRRSKLDCPEVMALYESGASDREIGEKVGVCETAVQKWRHRRGLDANYTCGGAPVRKENGHEDT